MRIISGIYRSRKLLPFKNKNIRPLRDQVREAAFNSIHFLPGWDWAEKRVIDLFCGTGALGLEALSRGASHATFVDRSPSSLQLAYENACMLGIPTAQVEFLCAHLLTFPVSSLFRSQVDLVFLDPPYGHKLIPKIMTRFPEGNNTLYAVFSEDREVTLPHGYTLLKASTFGKTSFQLMKRQEAEQEASGVES